MINQTGLQPLNYNNVKLNGLNNLKKTDEKNEIQSIYDSIRLNTVSNHVSGVQNNISFFDSFSTKEISYIQNSFNSGLKQNQTSGAELSMILRMIGLSNLEVNEQSIVSPENKTEIKRIQTEINKLLNTPEASKFGSAKQLKVNGYFDKDMILFVKSLKDTLRGNPVYLNIGSIAQKGSTACYLASEAMYFNHVHGKNTYNEFNTRKIIKSEDRKIEISLGAGVTSENNAGRITINRSKGIEMINVIDNDLNKNKPVIVGITSRKQGKGSEYNEGITDHFVLITGRGYDESGLYYTFNDPFSGGKDHKFRMEPLTGKLYGIGDAERKYEVTVANSYRESSNKYSNNGLLKGLKFN